MCPQQEMSDPLPSPTKQPTLLLVPHGRPPRTTRHPVIHRPSAAKPPDPPTRPQRVSPSRISAPPDSPLPRRTQRPCSDARLSPAGYTPGDSLQAGARVVGEDGLPACPGVGTSERVSFSRRGVHAVDDTQAELGVRGDALWGVRMDGGEERERRRGVAWRRSLSCFAGYRRSRTCALLKKYVTFRSVQLLESRESLHLHLLAI